MFQEIVGKTLCPFAGNATWQEMVISANGAPDQAPDQTPDQVIDAAVERLRTLIPTAEREGKDMVAVRFDDPEAIRDIDAFTRVVGELLCKLGQDPRSIGDDDVMLSHGWRFWVEHARCFVLTFAPFYAATHPRHSATGSAYLVFQFESSFERNGVTTMTPPQLRKLSEAVRGRFEEHGYDYLAEITHQSPESLHVIKPLRAGDPPVHWWRYADPVASSEAMDDHMDELTERGHIVFDRSLPDRRWFSTLYRLYDELADGLTPESIDELRRAAQAWLAVDDHASYYCGAPANYRDRHGLDGKRDKSYLQWCLEFARSEHFAATAVAKTDAMRQLSQRLQLLEGVTSRLFQTVLDDIGRTYPEYLALYDQGRPLPIIIKMLRYNKNPGQFATDPHWDKSALSLILNADDLTVRWRLGRGENCPLSQMVAPFAYPESATARNSSVLFAGLCLEKAGVPLPPTPHFVMPVEHGNHRHSVIAFLLTPHLPDTESLNTQATYIHDIMLDIR